MKRRIRFILAIGLVTSAFSFASISGAVADTVWDMATPYPDGNFHTKNIIMFAQDIEKETGGKFKIKVHSNASLLKMPDIKRGVQTRQAVLGEILLSAYGNEDPFFELDGIPFVSTGYDTAKVVWDMTRPFIEKRFSKNKLVVLYAVSWPGQGLYTKKTMNSVADFKGVKFRTYNAPTARLAELMGAVPTTIQAPEVPQAFATGLIDAMITSAITGVDSQAWDFVKYFYDVGALNNKNIVFMNAKEFNALDQKTQDIIRAAAARAEKRGWEMSAKAHEASLKKLAENGMIVTKPNEKFYEELKEIGGKMIQEWLKKSGTDGKEFWESYQK
jgi:TRAP-type C4-dicarboxylate transport system substrate-binding protein